MLRWSVVVLLIATLVACPFRCGGAFGVTCAVEKTAAAVQEPVCCSCGCCRQERSVAPESDSNSPLPEPCDCGNCVCEGAVLPEKVVFVVDNAPAIPLPAILASSIALEASQPSSCCVPAPEAEPTRSGRAIRVLHRSLLL